MADATLEYWQHALERRARLIDDVAGRLLRMDGNPPAVDCALMPLAAARKRLTAISPLACVSFVRAWRMDLGTWRRRLLSVPLLGDPEDSAKFLGLPAMERSACCNPVRPGRPRRGSRSVSARPPPAPMSTLPTAPCSTASCAPAVRSSGSASGPLHPPARSWPGAAVRQTRRLFTW